MSVSVDELRPLAIRLERDEIMRERKRHVDEIEHAWDVAAHWELGPCCRECGEPCMACSLPPIPPLDWAEMSDAPLSAQIARDEIRRLDAELKGLSVREKLFAGRASAPEEGA